MEHQRKTVERDDNEVVFAALNSLKVATAIPVAMYGTCDPQDGRLRIDKWVGLRTPALHDLVISPGMGVGGRVMSVRRPVGVSDYTKAKSITHEFDKEIIVEGLHSLVAVPVIVKRDMAGVLYAGLHSKARMGDKVLEEVTMIARCLEQDLAINAAMRAGASATPRYEPKTPDHGRAMRSLSGAEWEQIRSTHSKLRMLANRVEDESVQRELEVLADQLVHPVRTKPMMKLSAREVDVLSCVALGLTNVEAAEEMGIGAETVKSYLRSVMRKLDAHTRYEAVNAARRMGALP